MSILLHKASNSSWEREVLLEESEFLDFVKKLLETESIIIDANYENWEPGIDMKITIYDDYVE